MIKDMMRLISAADPEVGAAVEANTPARCATWS